MTEPQDNQVSSSPDTGVASLKFSLPEVVGLDVYVVELADGSRVMPDPILVGRNAEKPETWMAKRGAMVESDGGARVVMFNGSRQSVDSKTHQLSILYFDRTTYDLEATPYKNEIRYREARERTGIDYCRSSRLVDFLIEECAGADRKSKKRCRTSEIERPFRRPTT